MMTGRISDAMKDEEGDFDVAYVALFAIASAVFAAIPFMGLMTAIAYFRCEPIVKETVNSLCTFDPQPLGIAIGAVCGGFATALGALAGYMLATRRPPRSTSTSTKTIETEVRT